jgi:hypothetical protein
MAEQEGTDRAPWPDLPYAAWRETFATLHLWMQIVGKVRLSLTPWLNHSWHVTLYVTTRGLTTSPIFHGERAFQIDFDFLDHVLQIETSDGSRQQLKVRAQPVADFHAEVMPALADLSIEVEIKREAQRTARPDPLQRGSGARHLRSRIRSPLLPGAPASRPRAQDLPNGVHREMQPRPLLLGQLRFGGDAVLGSASTASSRRRPEPSG